MSPDIQGRVFLVGCPRSGTTLLQSLLAAHPRIASFPETHFFEAITGRRVWLGIASPRAWERRRLDLFLAAVGRPDLSSHVPRHSIRLAKYVEAFVDILDRLAIDEGADNWLEKTPGHVRHIQVIEKYLPGAQFIHLLRNGPDVVASLYEATRRDPKSWVAAFDLDECIDRWNEAVRISAGYSGLPNHIRVRYEELVAEPEKVLTGLCAFMGVDFAQDMIARHGVVAQSLILDSETWKAAARAGRIRMPRESKFDSVLSSEQRAYVLQHLEPIDTR